MSDAFDVFDPFEPLEAAEEPAVGGSAAEKSAAADRRVEGSTSAEPPARSEPPTEPAREPRATRRWTAPVARPTPPVDGTRSSGPARPEAERASGPAQRDAQRASAQARPDAPARRLPTGADFEDVLDAVLFGGAAERTADGGAREGEAEGEGASARARDGEGAVEGEDARARVGPTSPALVPADDLAAFRAIASPELEGAVERLLARGHLASLTDDLGQPEPAVVVRFRPNQGPLAAFGSTARKPARFELRLAPDLDGDMQVVAGYTLGAPDAPFTLLSRARLSTVRGDWVAQRLVDFVRRALALD